MGILDFDKDPIKLRKIIIIIPIYINHISYDK